MLPVVVNMGAWGIPPPPTRLEEIACEAGVPDNVMRQWLRAVARTWPKRPRKRVAWLRGRVWLSQLTALDGNPRQPPANPHWLAISA